MSFDGTQWISVPDNPAFAMTSATFSVWVKFTDTTKGDMNMIAKRSSDGSEAQWQFGYNGGGNNFKVSLANGTSGNSCCHDFNWSPSPALTQNVWYNIAVTIDNSSHTLTWYQNGLSKHTDNISGYSLGSEIPGTDLTLGASYNGTSELLYGLLDDVRIYNSALSSSEVADIAAGNSGPGVPTPTPTSNPTPTPSPTPTSSESNNSTSSPVNASTSCTSTASNAPNLFQVSTSINNATIYFAPASGASGYVVSYGTDSSANQYNTSFNNSETNGALSYTVNSLNSNTKYYFKVRSQNGCMPGPWSQTLSQITTSNETAQNLPTSNLPKNTTPMSADKTLSILKTTQAATPSSNPLQSGYSLTVAVQNNGTPVVGAVVQLHSTPQRTTTDKDGIARFANVAGGNHTVLLSYKGYQGQEKVAVNGNKKDIAINMTIKLNDTGITSPVAKTVIGILVIVIVLLTGFIFFLFRRGKKKKQQSS